MIRLELEISGTVQGVGSRPALAKAAIKAGLGGWVRNDLGVVRLCLVGESETVHNLAHGVALLLPDEAVVDHVRVVQSENVEEDTVPESFEIVAGASGNQGASGLVADRVPCASCQSEMENRHSRFHKYAFTSCTDCGPRYSILRELPWEREHTSMDAFPLCDTCCEAFSNPADRRFHAQTIACPACGPKLRFRAGSVQKEGFAALDEAAVALRTGHIVALRGVGGYQLACDARNTEAVARMRAAKQRPHKPLALMVADLSAARAIAYVSKKEAALLGSRQGPIVILRKKPAAEAWLEAISPDTDTVGIMLPSAPMHGLLFQALNVGDAPGVLVVTSGNPPGEPICLDPEAAEKDLVSQVDGFLHHNRPVLQRLDDSVVQVCDDGLNTIRRARGYTPGNIALGAQLCQQVLAVGADRKNSVAVGMGHIGILSQYVGDLQNVAVSRFHSDTIAKMLAFSGVEPQAVAVDLHPDMVSTRHGRGLASERDVAVVEVQHHHAHAAAAMVEHGLTDALALVLDGTGYGTDGAIWGAELLAVHSGSFERLATFCPVPLPGGDAAVLHPARQLLARWFVAGTALQDIHPDWWPHLQVTEQEAAIWQAQVADGLYCPQTHAAGRVFDSVAALAGIAPPTVTWEGQPAIRLEQLAGRHQAGLRPRVNLREVDGMLQVDWQEMFSSFAGVPPPDDRVGLAAGFHAALNDALVRMVEYGYDRTGTVSVVLTGGVLMNQRLRRSLYESLEKIGLLVYVPHAVPCGDGGVALGQLTVAGELV